MTILFHKIPKHGPWLLISQGGLNSNAIISEKGNASLWPEKYCCPPLYYLLPSPFQSLNSAPLEQHVVFTHRCHENTCQWRCCPSVMSSGSRAHMRTIRYCQRKEKQAFRCTEQSERETEINPGHEKQTWCYSSALCFMSSCTKVLVLGAFMDEIMNMVTFYNNEQQELW